MSGKGPRHTNSWPPMNWVKGSHDLKFGFDGRMHRTSYTQPGTPGGYFSYDFTGTSEFPYSGGGDAIASFMTGVGGPGSWGQYEIPNYVSTQSFQLGGFVQDNWKFNRKLTLNIGLRYDVNTPRSERYNRMNGFDPSVVSPVTAPGLGTLHGGEIFMTPSNRNNFNTDYGDIGPRIGFAYRAGQQNRATRRLWDLLFHRQGRRLRHGRSGVAGLRRDHELVRAEPERRCDALWEIEQSVPQRSETSAGKFFRFAQRRGLLCSRPGRQNRLPEPQRAILELWRPT